MRKNGLASSMSTLLSELSERRSVKAAIKVNWENYHYCLGQARNAELSVGRYLNWLMTDLPDHFMNLVVSTQVPCEGTAELINRTLVRFQSMRIQKFSWLVQEGLQSQELNTALLANGLIFREAYATEMAIDLSLISENSTRPPQLKIISVDDEFTLQEWIHVASRGFRIDETFEQVWHDLFVDTIFRPRYRTFLALLDGKPVGTSQLFLSAGVAGIYNVTVIPEARFQGIGSAVTLASLLIARRLGYRIGILQASKQGYSVYRRIGFQDVGKLSVYLWESIQKNGLNIAHH
jgi:GNAT superfamily N-acetyltransferase